MMNGRLQGRAALVIGAARGIGAGIAERVVEEGASVLIADTEEDRGRETAARLTKLGTVDFVSADISCPQGAEAAVAATVDRLGRVDILVQNAGIYPWTLIENIAPEEWDRVL